MDNFKYDFEKEYKDVVEEVSQKYHYNEDLTKVLTQITWAIVDGKSFEDRQRVYSVLRTTPIFVLTENSELTAEDLNHQMFGDNNPHIIDKEMDKGEYGKQKSAGSFCIDPIMDENLNIVGVKKYLFVDGFDTNQALSSNKQNRYDIFHTGINVSHLIHELGHAIVTQENPCSIKDNILTLRMGACEIQSRMTPLGNGKYEREGINISGLYIEEGLNTNFEEETLAKYLGVSLDEVKKLYGPVLIPSTYQGCMSIITEKFHKEPFKKDIDKWRSQGDKGVLDRLNSAFSKAEVYERRDLLYKRDETIKPDEEGNIVITKNRAFNDKNLPERTLEILEGLEKDYFEDPTEMTPMDMLDNILKQFYNTDLKKFNLPFEKYSELVGIMATEANAFIDQTTQIKNQSMEIEDTSK